MRLPVLLSLQGYERGWLRADLLAGLTVWAILVPEALAYATIAGVSPVVGLYAAPGALLLYAALGSSRQLVTGPMAATAALSAATVADAIVGSGGGAAHYAAMTAGLALTTGLVAVLAGALRLGFLANFISEPVLKGFIVGLALTIVVGQVPKLFGVDGADGDFFQQLWGVVRDLGDTDVTTLAVGGLSLAGIVALKRFVPAVPGSLAIVLLAIGASSALSLDAHGVAIVGPVAGGLPSLGTPDVSLHDLGTLVAGGVGVMLVGFAESLGAAKTYAARAHEEIDANRELIGLGGANLAAGLSSGMVVNGSLSKTAVNADAGARSQLSGLVVAVLTVVTLLALTGLFEHLPEATLAAVVIVAVAELIDVRALVALWRAAAPAARRDFGVAAWPDFLAAMAALLGVTVLDTLPGLFVGIGVSILLLVYRASRPHVAVLGRDPATGRYADVRRHPGETTLDDVPVLRVEGSLYFANAYADGVRAVVLDMQTVPFVDVTAARMLGALADELAARDVELLAARETGTVRDAVAATLGATRTIRVHATVRDAVAAAD
jgi:sulfate permease, SulP family